MVTSDTATKAPGRCAPVECCPEPACECGLRNNYFEGKRLTPDMFRVEQRYFVERRRLLNRAIHGWGVVYGYPVESRSTPRHKAPASRSLHVGAGLALDERGRELLLADAVDVTFDDVLVLDARGRVADRASTVAAETRRGHARVCWLLRVHYAEQPLHHVRVADECRCEHDHWDHTCETVRFSLQCLPCDDCCRDWECELDCGCSHGRGTRDRPGLCDHVMKRDPGSDCRDHLCVVDEPCGRVRVDVEHGVPLACVALTLDECGDWTFAADVEACGPRRLVKSNDLLFDLMRGCDLTRITDISWKDWHRRQDVPFERFREFLCVDTAGDNCVTNFHVTFSCPVRLDTLRVDCFVMTVVTAERDDGWWETLRVPIVDLVTGDRRDGDPPDHVRSARLVVGGDWFRDTVDGYSNVFSLPTRVEIEIRGDFIIDCNGQAADLNAHGLTTKRTGNRTPGGTFLSVFGVDRRPADLRPPSTDRGPKGVTS